MSCYSLLNLTAKDHPFLAICDFLFIILTVALCLQGLSPPSANWGQAMPWWQQTDLTLDLHNASQEKCVFKNYYRKILTVSVGYTLKMRIPDTRQENCVFKHYYKPILMYVAETRGLLRVDINRLTEAELKFLIKKYRKKLISNRRQYGQILKMNEDRLPRTGSNMNIKND